MAEKILKARVQMKTDTEENWLNAINFIPKNGEIIIYAIDSNHSYQRIKIGDGVTLVNNLPFVNESNDGIEYSNGDGLPVFIENDDPCNEFRMRWKTAAEKRIELETQIEDAKLKLNSLEHKLSTMKL